MNGWFPRFSRFGQIASGQGELWINNQFASKPGYQPQWFDDFTVYYIGPNDFLYYFHNGEEKLFVATPVIKFSAGFGKYHIINRKAGEIGVSIDKYTGYKALLVEHNNENTDHSIFLDDKPIVEHQNVTAPRVNEGLLCWSHYTQGNFRLTYGLDPKNGEIYNLTVMKTDWEGFPIPFRVNDEPWVLIQTNVDIRLHPWVSDVGYIIPTGEDKNFNPDVIFFGGKIKVVYTDSAGRITVKFIDPTDPRIKVSQVSESPVPNPVPNPVPKENKMLMPQDAYEVYVEAMKEFPPTGDVEQRRKSNDYGIASIRNSPKVKNADRYVAKTEHSHLGERSKDAVSFVPLEEGKIEHGKKMKMFTWDMINGETREVFPNHESYPLDSRYVLIDHLEKIPNHPPAPNPKPVPSVDDLALLIKRFGEYKELNEANIGALNKSVVELKKANEDLHLEISLLKQRPSVTLPAGVAMVGYPVVGEAKVPFGRLRFDGVIRMPEEKK